MPLRSGLETLQMNTRTGKPAANWSISRLIREIAVPGKHLEGLRRQQLDAVRNMTVVVLLANLLNVAVVLLSFSGSSVGGILSIWGICFVFMIGYRLVTYLRERSGMAGEEDTKKLLEAVSRGASVSGIFWALAPLVVMSAVDPKGQMVMGIVMAGMMFAGAFLFSRIPEAAFSLIIPVGVGVVV